MAERTGFVTYMICSVFMGILIFPVVGHWVWGDLLYPENQSWLAKLGFIDFAGATVVHSTGAWVALIGVWQVGPRIGRYKKSGELREFESHSLALRHSACLYFGLAGGDLTQEALCNLISR